MARRPCGAGCGRTTDLHHTVCLGCGKGLRRLLAEFARRRTELPDDEQRFILHHTVLAWTAHIATATGQALPKKWSSVATFLQGNVSWLSRRDEGPQAVDELHHALSLRG